VLSGSPIVLVVYNATVGVIAKNAIHTRRPYPISSIDEGLLGFLHGLTS
jgi:hypothetical protein